MLMLKLKFNLKLLGLCEVWGLVGARVGGGYGWPFAF
jgi:hypothetical protein